jgi:hypothetical protein
MAAPVRNILDTPSYIAVCSKVATAGGPLHTNCTHQEWHELRTGSKRVRDLTCPPYMEYHSFFSRMSLLLSQIRIAFKYTICFFSAYDCPHSTRSPSSVHNDGQRCSRATSQGLELSHPTHPVLQIIGLFKTRNELNVDRLHAEVFASRLRGPPMGVSSTNDQTREHPQSVAHRGVGVWGVQTSRSLRNSEVLTKPSRIPCSVKNTSVTT